MITSLTSKICGLCSYALHMGDFMKRFSISSLALVLALIFGVQNAWGGKPAALEENTNKYRVMLFDFENDVGQEMTSSFEKYFIELADLNIEVIRDHAETSPFKRYRARRSQISEYLQKHNADLIVSGSVVERRKKKSVKVQFFGVESTEALLEFPSASFKIHVGAVEATSNPLLTIKAAQAMANKFPPKEGHEHWYNVLYLYRDAIRRLDVCYPVLDGFTQVAYAGDIVWPAQDKCGTRLLLGVLNNLTDLNVSFEYLGQSLLWASLKKLLGDTMTFYNRTNSAKVLDSIRNFSDTNLDILENPKQRYILQLSASYFVAQATRQKKDIDTALSIFRTPFQLDGLSSQLGREGIMLRENIRLNFLPQKDNDQYFYDDVSTQIQSQFGEYYKDVSSMLSYNKTLTLNCKNLLKDDPDLKMAANLSELFKNSSSNAENITEKISAKIDECD